MCVCAHVFCEVCFIVFSILSLLLVGPPTLVGIGTLEFTLVRACARPCVRKILNDYPLYFSEILHGVTTFNGGGM